MNDRSTEIIVLPLAALFTLGLLWLAWQAEPEKKIEPRPDFAAIKDVKRKKETFFNYMLPKVRSVNDQVLEQREQLLMVVSEIEDGRVPGSRDAQWLQNLATTYRVKGDPLTSASTREKLLKRVDIVQASLALAQAANESAWGTARFARNGNNFFGMWCWVRNCGMIPTEREPAKKHEVARFDSVDAGVGYYVLTLNSHPAYQELRDRRLKARQQAKPLSGMELASGLERYSERGQDYIEEIRAMIRVNKLQRFNREINRDDQAL